jgi:RNA polymerase sigma-70 factor (ECF subfamily)
VTETTFVQHLLKYRSVHEAMLVALVGDPTAADDLYQQAALVMTRKREEIPEDCRFLPWSRQVLLNVVRDFRKHKARQRVALMDEQALERVAGAFEQLDEGVLDARRTALGRCLEKLEPSHRELLHARYEQNRSIDELAAESSRSRGAVETLLYSLRRALTGCVERALKPGGVR